jgi:hypothetical protein
MYLGDYKNGSTIYFCWNTNDRNGASITRATNGSIKVYKDNNTAECSAGITDVEDFDSITGVHNCRIDLSADAFYEQGHDYSVVLAGAVIDGVTVNAVIASFSIENRSVDAALLDKAAKMLMNRAVQDKLTGEIKYYDEDGQTVILTHTPEESEMEIVRKPS